jgi:hypothetical protein
VSPSRDAAAAGAETAPAHPDPRLRGRTYAIPFEDVWQAALALAGGRQRGWRVLAASDETGVIRAAATRRFPVAVDDVVIRVMLDADAQTRVDARAAAREGRAALRRNTRRLVQFFRALDLAVERTAAQRRRPTAPRVTRSS